MINSYIGPRHRFNTITSIFIIAGLILTACGNNPTAASQNLKTPTPQPPLPTSTPIAFEDIGKVNLCNGTTAYVRDYTSAQLLSLEEIQALYDDVCTFDNGQASIRLNNVNIPLGSDIDLDGIQDTLTVNGEIKAAPRNIVDNANQIVIIDSPGDLAAVDELGDEEKQFARDVSAVTFIMPGEDPAASGYENAPANFVTVINMSPDKIGHPDEFVAGPLDAEQVQKTKFAAEACQAQVVASLSEDIRNQTWAGIENRYNSVVQAGFDEGIAGQLSVNDAYTAFPTEFSLGQEVICNANAIATEMDLAGNNTLAVQTEFTQLLLVNVANYLGIPGANIEIDYSDYPGSH